MARVAYIFVIYRTYHYALETSGGDQYSVVAMVDGVAPGLMPEHLSHL
jgi:hypothetical protein